MAKECGVKQSGRKAVGKKDYTPKTKEERDAEMKVFSEMLEAGLSEIQSSEDFIKWLNFQRQFRRYSFGNMMLILMQYEDPEQVAAFHTWRKMGRMVRKGEKSIKIFAPMIANREDKATGETKKVLIGYRLVSVFSIKQTDGPEVPTFNVPLSLDGEADESVYNDLVEVARDQGFRVFEGPSEQGEGGWYNRATNEIKMCPDVCPGVVSRIRVITHEMAHGMDDKLKETSRSVRETVADGVAYIVCSYLGVPVGDANFRYIANWNSGQEDGLKNLREALDRIQKISRKILDGFDARRGQGTPVTEDVEEEVPA